jgi:hypothetical protein
MSKILGIQFVVTTLLTVLKVKVKLSQCITKYHTTKRNDRVEM